jgi:linoleate 9S-lipoxygenase
MAVLEILSKHAKNEVYVGQIDGSTPEWADGNGIAEAFHRFSSRLVQVEKNVTARNNNPNLKNRLGPALVPYTLLYPNTTDLSKSGGLTGRGIPNSTSI